MMQIRTMMQPGHAAAAPACRRRVARLRQEALHDAEEQVAVVGTRLAELEEVAAGQRRVREVQVRDDVPHGRLEEDGHRAVARGGKRY